MILAILYSVASTRAQHLLALFFSNLFFYISWCLNVRHTRVASIHVMISTDSLSRVFAFFAILLFLLEVVMEACGWNRMGKGLIFIAILFEHVTA